MIRHSVVASPPAMFKIKCNLPELRPPNAQNTVKIDLIISSVIHHKCDLLS